MVTETQEEKEARWAAERERQRLYRESPEGIAAIEARIQSGQCYYPNGWCVTHNTEATTAHHFDINPEAYND